MLGDTQPECEGVFKGVRVMASGDISGDLIQLLSPEGERVAHDEYSVDFSADEYRSLYRDLVLVRRFDTEATALQRQGELGLWAPSLGQEAAQIGSGRALREQDTAFPTYREHGVAWCRGLDPMSVIQLYRGVSHGGWNPHDHRFFLYTIVIGAQTLHATGYAMGVAKDGKVGSEDGEAVVAYLGDGATSEGDVSEALIWAGVYGAPVVFFCQNNQYAISEPAHRQSPAPLYQRGPAFGMPGVRVDGNDVLASYAVTRAALQRARRGEGPTFIEAYTYRIGAHTTSDDPTRYRSASEVDEWKRKDPITRYRAFLLAEQLADDGFFADVQREADELAARVRRETHALPDPAPASMFEHAYAEGSPEVAAELRDYLAYADSFADVEGSGR